jgi:hypothetical protein
MRDALQWSDFSLPEHTRKEGNRLLWRGSLLCAFGAVVTAFVCYRMWVVPTGQFFPDFWLMMIGVGSFVQGDSARWAAQQWLSRLTAYRRERGHEELGKSTVPTQALYGRPYRSSIGFMVLGVLLCGVGSAMITSSLQYLRDVGVGGEGPSWELYGYLVTLLLGIINMVLASAIFRVEVQHHAKVISSPKALALGSYTLYLRSFSDDPRLARPPRFPGLGTLVRGFLGRSEEERLDAALAWTAPIMVGVGAPGERLPRAGATRMYLQCQDWQEPVREMMQGARFVVIVLGHGPGTVWELGEAMRILPPQRLLLVVPLGPKEYDKFRRAAETELRKQAERVRRETGALWAPPALPDYVGTQMISSRIQGLIYFAAGWEPVFVRLKRPPALEDQLIGALDRGMWPAMVQLTDYERRTSATYG